MVIVTNPFHTIKYPVNGLRSRGFNNNNKNKISLYTYNLKLKYNAIINFEIKICNRQSVVIRLVFLIY